MSERERKGFKVVLPSLFDKLKATVKAQALNEVVANVRIIPSAFGDKAPVWGAVSMVCRELYKNA